MSENNSKKPEKIAIGFFIILMIIFLILSIIQKNYADTTSIILILFCATPIAILSFYIAKQFKQEKNLWLLFPFFMVLAFLINILNDYIIDKVFENQPQKEFCGILISEFTTGQGRTERLNWKIHNPRTKEELDFRKPNNPHLQVGHHLCVYYAIDKHWQPTPYIFHIEQK